MGEYARFGRRVPVDLCGAHRRIWRDWQDYSYDPRNPREPGGGQMLDSRTTHTERAEAWDRHNQGQMDLTERICRSGESPQCGPAVDRG